MANWYMTRFKTTDKDIADIIKNGRTIDFQYEENNGIGYCCLAWGLCSIDIARIEEIAKEHKSSFYIYSSDSLSNTEQEWKYQNGIEVLSEIRHDVFEWIDNGDVINVVRKQDAPPLDEF